jgi:glucose-1-phosphate thymidylyltransferase
MKIIVPMAGMGKRMRPHTLTVPKPLIPVGGKPIVQRLVEDLAATIPQQVEEVAFIIGPTFGKEVEKNLIAIAESIGAKGSIYYQEEALGTAHAIYCAEPALSGNVMVAFADTLFKTDYKISDTAEGVIFVHKVEDPSAFGVVKLNVENHITDFVEKPAEFVSDLAIIGIYYFKDGDYLKSEIKYLLDNDIKDKGEYQLTNALENMKNKGTKFLPGKVEEWLDCGNKDATVYTNQRVLELKKGKEKLVADSLNVVNSVIIEPCFIGENVIIENSVVGPHVSIGDKTKISNSVLSNSIVQTNSVIQQKVIHNSMIGNFVNLSGAKEDLSIGDYIITK